MKESLQMNNNKTRFVDLHTHSTASDGSCTPAEIVNMAAEKGLAAVALTDHDTVSGLEEFMREAENFPDLQAVPGVEISTDLLGSEAHIVGLFINYNCPSLNKLLKQIRKNRNHRNNLIIAKLRERGYDISLEEILTIAKGESVGRPHFAKILISKGYFSENQEVFDKCLKKGTPGYVKRQLPSPSEAIAEIHNAGGVAIWAHALYRRENEREYVSKTLKILIKAGLDGVETHYTTFSPEQQSLMQEFAERHQLLQSGGSDFHGSAHVKTTLGEGYGNLRVPEELFRQLATHEAVKGSCSNNCKS